jgi:single-stranded DNA-binding protein
MSTTNLQKQANALERLIKKASRALLEFEVAQSKWEAKNGLGKVYSSVDAIMRDAKKGVKI